MILLDTHIWYWWAGESPRLTTRHHELIDQHLDDGLGLSAISCWEVAKKHYLGKLELDRPLDQWIAEALALPGLRLLPMSPAILVESARLPDGFRSDPADEIIIATARLHSCPLLTADQKLLEYSGVTTLA